MFVMKRKKSVPLFLDFSFCVILYSPPLPSLCRDFDHTVSFCEGVQCLVVSLRFGEASNSVVLVLDSLSRGNLRGCSCFYFYFGTEMVRIGSIF